MKEKDQGSLSTGDVREEAMIVKHKNRGPRLIFCNKFGHIQRNCYEPERRLMLENSQTSHN